MHITETRTIVKLATLNDARPTTDEAVSAWHEALGYLDYDFAVQATLDALESPGGMIMPAHIIDCAQALASNMFKGHSSEI